MSNSLGHTVHLKKKDIDHLDESVISLDMAETWTCLTSFWPLWVSARLGWAWLDRRSADSGLD